MSLQRYSGKVKAEAPPQTDELSRREAIAIANDYTRVEAKKTHFHLAGILILWVFVLGVLILAGVWLFHLVTPSVYHFLPADQRSEIQNILLTALGSSAATGIAKKFIDEKSN